MLSGSPSDWRVISLEIIAEEVTFVLVLDEGFLEGLELHADARDGDEADLLENIQRILIRLVKIYLKILSVDISQMNSFHLPHQFLVFVIWVNVFEVEVADAGDLLAGGTIWLHLGVKIRYIKQFNSR